MAEEFFCLVRMNAMDSSVSSFGSPFHPPKCSSMEVKKDRLLLVCVLRGCAWH